MEQESDGTTASSGGSAQPSWQALLPRTLTEIPRKYINTLFSDFGDPWPVGSGWKVGQKGEQVQTWLWKVLGFHRSPGKDRGTPFPCGGRFLMGGSILNRWGCSAEHTGLRSSRAGQMSDPQDGCFSGVISRSTSRMNRRHSSSCQGRATHCTATGRPTLFFMAYMGYRQQEGKK